MKSRPPVKPRGAAPRGKVRPTISRDPLPPPAKRRGSLLPPAAPAAAADAKPPYDPKKDPDVIAYACLLSYDSGWLQEPSAVSWSFDDKTKMVEVQRPEGVAETREATRGRFSMSLEASISEIHRRWGLTWSQKVRIFIAPLGGSYVGEAGDLLGPRAWYLKNLAAQTYTAGGTRALIEVALVDVARRCADLVRNANLGDTSMSAQTTRNVAAGFIIEMLNPPPGRTS